MRIDDHDSLISGLEKMAQQPSLKMAKSWTGKVEVVSKVGITASVLKINDIVNYIEKFHWKNLTHQQKLDVINFTAKLIDVEPNSKIKDQAFGVLGKMLNEYASSKIEREALAQRAKNLEEQTRKSMDKNIETQKKESREKTSGGDLASYLKHGKSLESELVHDVDDAPENYYQLLLDKLGNRSLDESSFNYSEKLIIAEGILRLAYLYEKHGRTDRKDLYKKVNFEKLGEDFRAHIRENMKGLENMSPLLRKKLGLS